MLTKLFAAPVKVRSQYAHWLKAIDLARFDPAQAPIPLTWIHQGFYSELEIHNPEQVLAQITKYVVKDMAGKQATNTTGKLLAVLLQDYSGYAQLQLFCAEKILQLKKAPPLAQEIAQLAKIVAQNSLDQDHSSAIADLSLLIEQLHQKTTKAIANSTQDFARALTLAEKDQHERAEELLQKAYQKTKTALPPSTDRELVIVFSTLLAANFRLQQGQAQKAYTILMQILGPNCAQSENMEGFTGPLHSTLNLLMSWYNEQLIAKTLLQSILLLHKTLLALGAELEPEQQNEANYAISYILGEISPLLLPAEHIFGLNGSDVGFMYPEKYRDLYKGPLPDVDENIRQTVIMLCEHLHNNLTIKLDAEYYAGLAAQWKMNSFNIMSEDNEKWLVDFDDPETPFEEIIYTVNLPDLERRGFIIYSPQRTWFTLRKDLINCHSYNVLVEQGLLDKYEAGFLKMLLQAVRFQLGI